VLLLAIGMVAAPLTALVFPSFTGRGYALAKPLGVLLLGYIYWIGVTADILPNTRVGVLIALALIAVLSGAATWYRRPSVQEVRGSLPFMIGVEVVFLAAFAAAAFLRSYVPEIAATEKPMEVGFLNAVLRADGFPPNDPWFAGEPISYYYFGFVLLAAIAKLGGTEVATAFNLGLSLIFALSAVAIFGLAYELISRAMGELPRPRVRSVTPALFGLIGVGMALVLANLEGAFELGIVHGFGSEGLYSWLDVSGLEAPKASSHWYPDEHWWWWRATRVVPETITEFPYFSFMLGDLHPHVMAIPFRFLMFAFVAGVVLGGGAPPSLRTWLTWPGPAVLAVISVLLGSMGFLSTWDLPTLAALLAAAALLVHVRARSRPLDALAGVVGFAGPPLVLGLIAFLPFWLSVDSPGWGPRVVTDASTSPQHLLLVWGSIGVVVLAFVGVALARGDRATLRNTNVWWAAAAVVVLPLVAWAVWTAVGTSAGLSASIESRGWGWLTDAVLALAIVGTIVALLQRAIPAMKTQQTEERAAAFALLLTLFGLLLVFGVEFFYVDDILHNRLNSVFKLYFQAWLLLAAAGGFGLWYVARSLFAPAGSDFRAGDVTATLGSVVLVLVLAAGLVYPVTATFARTEGFAGPRTLDGFAWLRHFQPNEYRALMWLREHSEPDDIVLEGYGDAYGDGGRVSSRTGTPTLLGWWIHEINWRGDKPDFAQRAGVIEQIYRSNDPAEMRRLLEENGVDWVFVGSYEFQRYAGVEFTKFASFMDVAYEDGAVRVYRTRTNGNGQVGERGIAR
jgi:YYY domain-containing protein